MGYEILYHRFSVYDPEKKTLTPYIIHGSNNCTYGFSMNGRQKRERNLINVKDVTFKKIGLDEKYHTIQMYISNLYKQLKPDVDSGYWRRVPSTLQGFSGMFYNKIITKYQFDQYKSEGNDAENLDWFLGWCTKQKLFQDFEDIKCNIVGV